MESTLSLTSTEYIAGGTGKPSLPEESLGRTEQFPYVSSELHSEGSFDPWAFLPFALRWLSVVSGVSGSGVIFRQMHFQLPAVCKGALEMLLPWYGALQLQYCQQQHRVSAFHAILPLRSSRSFIYASSFSSGGGALPVSVVLFSRQCPPEAGQCSTARMVSRQWHLDKGESNSSDQRLGFSSARTLGKCWSTRDILLLKKTSQNLPWLESPNLVWIRQCAHSGHFKNSPFFGILLFFFHWPLSPPGICCYLNFLPPRAVSAAPHACLRQIHCCCRQ